MAQLKAQLEAAGFDTAGLDEASLLSQLDQAGYDTSTLGGGETPSQPQMAAEAAPSSEPVHPEESKGRKFARKVANALPTVGGIGGGIALGIPGTVFGVGVGGIPAAAAGAGIGAAGGTAAKQLILRALGDKEGVPQTSGEAAKEIGFEGAKDAALTYTGAKVLKGIGKGGMLIKDLVTKPGAAEVALAGKEGLEELEKAAMRKIGDVTEKGAEKLALARSTREAAKKGLIEAEEKAGLHFESTPGFESFIKDPKKMAEFSQKIGRLAKQTPEELAQSIPSEQLQLFRKIAQEGEKVSGLSDIANSQLRNGKDVFTRALGIQEKGIGESLGKFRDADKVVGEIPAELKSRLVAQKARNLSDISAKKLSNAREVLDAKSLDKKRKVIKGLAGAAAGYLGLKSLLK